MSSAIIDEVAGDLEGVVGRWGAGGVDVRAVAGRAVEVVQGRVRAAGGTSDAVVVGKWPHVGAELSVGAVVGRLLAFGVEVRGARRLGATGGEVAAALYPQARRGFERVPAAGSAAWGALGEAFGGERFAAVFGRAFDPAMVVAGGEAVERFGLGEGELTELWEAGRRPLGRDDMVGRYGRDATDAVMGGEATYEWFRGAWPFGIQRVRSGLVAFALRHERLGDEPIVVLNGHFPGLAELFGPGTWVVDIGLEAGGPSIAEVRAAVIGDDNRPERGPPGSIRRDALDGRFPLDPDANAPVDARHNLVHCSDGLAAGAIERARLLGEPAGGELVRRLVAGGLTPGEVAEIVMAVPVVERDGDERALTDVTRRQGLDDCVATIGRFVPPVFGAANGHTSGLGFRAFAVAARTLAGLGGDVVAFSRLDEGRRPLQDEVPRVGELDDAADEQRGRAALVGGRVGVLVPAGGTGGRFGGYDLLESDPRRQKALAAVLRARGAERSSLDIRLANARYWREADRGAGCPVAIMAGPTNGDAVRRWCAQQPAAGIDVFEQHGAYRLQADLVGEPDRWVDAILRSPDGTPLLKPPGSLGLLTAFVLSGGYERWRRRGVEVLAIANADDIGARLDPRVLGHMERHDLDAVVVAVPQGFRAVASESAPVELRGDASGWCIDALGRRRALGADGLDVAYDRGGVVCEVKGKRRWRTAVVEGPAMAGDDGPPGSLFNTNQLYLRAAALDRLLGDDGPVRGAQRLVDLLPLYAERKQVDAATAIQLLQPVADVVRLLDRVGVVHLDRWPTAHQRGGYLPLKRPSDVPFAQHLLDHLAAAGDDLRFDPT